jgi:hypothetical protein
VDYSPLIVESKEEPLVKDERPQEAILAAVSIWSIRRSRNE